ncbi:MAG TPA: hypothetical protein VJA16_06230 [Thermoanaerobaculia bacterium]
MLPVNPGTWMKSATEKSLAMHGVVVNATFPCTLAEENSGGTNENEIVGGVVV